MKRKMTALVMVMMLVLSLAACGGKKEEPKAPETAAATEAATEAETEAATETAAPETEAVTEAPAESEAPETEAETAAEIPQEEDGTYYELSLIEEGDMRLEADVLHAMNAGYLLLRNDGTASMVLMGSDPEELTWDDQKIYSEDEGIEYTIDGDILHLEKDGAVMEFTKTTWEELNAALEPVAAADGYDPENRQGYYKLSSIEMGEEVLDATIIEAGGMKIFMVLREGGTGELVMASDTAEVLPLEWDDEKMTVDGEETEYIYLDGVISVVAEGAGMNFVYAGTVDEAPEYETEAAE